MKMNMMFLGIAATVVAVCLAFSGCDMPDGGGNNGNRNPGVPGLDDINEPTTGRATITGKDIDVPFPDWYGNDDFTEEDYLAMDWELDGEVYNEDGDPESIFDSGVEYATLEKGKLSFKISASNVKPQVLVPVSRLLLPYISEDDSVNISNDFSVGTVVGRFDFETSLETGGYRSVYIDRTAFDIGNYDGETGLGWYRFSQIFYMYVSDSVTVSSGGWSHTYDGEDSNGNWIPINENVKAFKLELKKGWNLVQWDELYESAVDSVSYTYLIKIADKNVPWYIDGWGSSSRTARGNPAGAFDLHSRPGLFAGR